MAGKGKRLRAIRAGFPGLRATGGGPKPRRKFDAVIRMGRDLPVLPALELKRGDELRLIGAPADLDRIRCKIGYDIPAATVTDLVFFGLGMTIGVALGLIQCKLGGVPVSIRTVWRLGVIDLHEANVFDDALAALPQATKEWPELRYCSLTTDPGDIRFIDRLVADSRAVALNHAARRG